jgi:hypothetical protein
MKQGFTVFVLQIDGERSLVTMKVLFVRATPTAGHRIALGILSRWGFDLDDVGAPVSQ